MGWLQSSGKKLDSWLFGKGTQALVPPDMRGLRAQNINLLSQLLSPGAFNPGGTGRNFFFQGGSQGASQFFDQPSPETKTMDSLMPLLEGMMTGTGPQFERDIAMANTSGGRFSSGNAIMRGEALRNLFNQRGQTANTMGMLASNAGNSQMARQQMFAQLMAGLLGMGTQATMQFPVENDQGFFGDVLKIAAAFAGAKGGGGSAPKISTPTSVPSGPTNV